MRKVHLFLVFLALLGLSGCTETQKESQTSPSSSRKVTSASSTTVSVKTKERTEPNPPMPAEVAERLKIKEDGAEVGTQQTLPSSKQDKFQCQRTRNLLNRSSKNHLAKRIK